MDKLRVLPLVFVCGLLSIPAFAQQVSEFNVFMTQTNPDCSDANPGACIYFPTFNPLGGVSGSDFAYMASSGGGCFGGCPLPLFNGHQTLPSWMDFDMLGVSFHTPVTTVTALQMVSSTGPDVGSSYSPELLAFDGQQLVAECIAQAPSACFTDTTVLGSINGTPVQFQGNLTVSAPVITSVWVGTAPDGWGPGGSAPGIQYSVPEPGAAGMTLLLTLGLAGVGFASRGRKDWS